MDPFEDFPDELIIEQALHVYDLPSIASFCLTSKRFNRVICNNEEFWRLKFRQENGNVMSNYRGSWKKLYQEYNAVYTFGYNHTGQLGLGDREDRSALTKIDNLKGKFASCGFAHTVIVDPEGDVWICGDNELGQLGLEDFEETLVPIRISGIKAQAVSAGYDFTFILDFDNNVWSFGNNDHGQLGLGDFKSRSVPTQIPNIKAKTISAGTIHANIIDLEGNVWLCGNMITPNRHDQRLYVQFPQLQTQVYSRPFRGNFGDELEIAIFISEFLPPIYQFNKNPVLMEGMKAQSIAAGYESVLVIDEYNDIWGIGNGEYLGVNDNQIQLDFKRIPNLKAKAISSTLNSTVVIDLEENVWTFGKNVTLGADSLIPMQIPGVKAVKVAKGGNLVYAIDNEKNIWVYGFVARGLPKDANDVDSERDIYYYGETITNPGHRMTVFYKFTQIPDIKVSSIAASGNGGAVVIIGIRPSSLQ